MAQTSLHTLGDRRYWLTMPDEQRGIMPCVFALHGMLGRVDGEGSTKFGTNFRKVSHLEELADARRCMIVWPEGNSALKPWHLKAKPGNPDVRFLRAILHQLAQKWIIDIRSVYCWGFSAGANLALICSEWWRACRAAVAVGYGWLGNNSPVGNIPGCCRSVALVEAPFYLTPWGKSRSAKQHRELTKLFDARGTKLYVNRWEWHNWPAMLNETLYDWCEKHRGR